MKVFLEGLLPRRFPHLEFLCVAHEGKSDLERSIPRKLQAWREPGVRFVVVRDKDADDCMALKQRLLALCAARSDTVVRIACNELEAWYFGDPRALAEVFDTPGLARIAQQARFRQPDAIVQPSRALAELAPGFQKVSGARAMAQRLDPSRNSSTSFGVFISAVDRLSSAAAGS